MCNSIDVLLNEINKVKSQRAELIIRTCDEFEGGKWFVHYYITYVRDLGFGVRHTLREKSIYLERVDKLEDALSEVLKLIQKGNSNLYGLGMDVKEFVMELFENKYDKGGHPYINHLEAVEKGVDTIECKIVALLHDVLEDTDKTENDLKDLGVPEYLINSVVRLTRTEDKTYNEYIDDLIESGDIIALKVKKADLEHNMDIRRIPNPTQKDYDRVEKRYKPVYEKVCRKIKGVLDEDICR